MTKVMGCCEIVCGLLLLSHTRWWLKLGTMVVMEVVVMKVDGGGNNGERW